MNHRKRTASLGFPSLVLLVIAVVIVSSGGVGYVVMKNKQITTRSKIVEVQRQMDEHKVFIALHTSNIEEALGYYALRARLEEMNSPLTEIKLVEVCRDSDEQSPPGDSIARR